MDELNRRRFLVTGASLPAAALPAVALRDHRDLSIPHELEAGKREIVRRFSELSLKDSEEVFSACLTCLYTGFVSERPDLVREGIALLDDGHSVAEFRPYVDSRNEEDES